MQPTVRISLFSLVMLTVLSVDSLRNLPAAAIFGSKLVFFYCLAALCFLLPTTLACADLSTMFRKPGGVYLWVKAAFGPKIGLLAVWLQWIQNVIWYPTILAFVSATTAYILAPQWLGNPIYMSTSVAVLFALVTWLNIKGMEQSVWFSNFASIIGLMLPMALIIILGIHWYVSGQPMAVDFSMDAMMPDWNIDSWLSLVNIMLCFSGIEIATVYGRDIDNPQKKLPSALGIAVLIILSTMLLSALSIAIVVPGSSLSLVAGIMQAFEVFFKAYHLQWLLNWIGVFLVIGGMGSVSNWVIAPARGLIYAAKDDQLPQWFAHENGHQSPDRLLLVQGVIVILLALVFVFIPGIAGAFWWLTALASQLYMGMYILVFAAWVKHRHQGKMLSVLSIKGDKKTVIVIASIGAFACGLTMLMGFMLPKAIKWQGHMPFWLTIGCMGMILLIPVYFLPKISKKQVNNI